MLRGGLSLEWKRVQDVLVPRVDVSAIDADADYEACFAMFGSEGYSRLLVMDGTPDADLGYLAAKDFLHLAPDEREDWRARKGARAALRVPASLPLQDLLLQMRQSGIHFAVVKDEYGGTEGIVTLEDLLEELVGEIRDEHDADEIPPVREIKAGTWAIRGEVSVRELTMRLGLRFEEEAEARTLGGYIAERLGRVPREGDRVEFGNLRFRVVRTEENRVLLVRVTRKT
ncbi:MAG: HlyC/CorC family transporter [Planctomycetes bacterium]|nr:HlyC/CorC family transporter [Planctomycetota bacterium]